MKHMVNWIEIPVADMSRAVKFYESVLGVKLSQAEMGPNRYAFFPSEDRFNNGALVQGEGYVPSPSGIVIYLDGGDDLDKLLAKVKKAGGTVVLPKTFFSKEAGWLGLFTDSEGNRIGLHHM